MQPFHGVVASMCPQSLAHGQKLLEHRPAGIAAVELRADYLSAADTWELLDQIQGVAILTIRSTADGGAFSGSEAARQIRLGEAFNRGDVWVDVEWGAAADALCRPDRDERTILSWHGGSSDPAEWGAELERMTSSGKKRIKRVVTLRRVEDLQTVQELQVQFSKDKRVTIFADGFEGSASRWLTLSWGGWGTYAAWPGAIPTASGQLPADRMITALNSFVPSPVAVLLGMAVEDSPSPAMHQAALAAREARGAYLALSVASFEPGRTLACELFGDALRGLAVTAPFKTQAAELSRTGDEIVERSGAANTLVYENSQWVAYNTDGPAIREQLHKHGLRSKDPILILGAGGTARAGVVALVAAGHPVFVAVRNAEARKSCLENTGARVIDWEERGKIHWRGLVQATPLGRNGEQVIDPTPARGGVVLDAVYGPHETPLMHAARRSGCKTIDGFELLAAQGVLQHEKFYGVRPSRDAFLRVARSHLDATGDRNA